MFLDRISSLKSCWVWSWRLWVEDLMVDPVLYWRILVVVVGVVMVAGGVGGVLRRAESLGVLVLIVSTW